ncbi:MAG: DUF4417 domain-containing protein [Abditibacteriota bacterium]|nr:DUF4417 domain-containing protein [Abditibacteriota bacterium]
MTVNISDIPVIKGSSVRPEGLLPFNYSKTRPDYSAFVHFFVADRQFERVFKRPLNYIPLLARFQGVIGTDFSIYADDPLPVCIYNTWRNRYLDAAFQLCGIEVIPSVSWGADKTFDVCFGCIAPGSSVAVSTNGCENPVSRQLFEAGYREMIRRIRPEFIVLYGPRFDFVDGDNVLQFDSYLQDMRKRLK